MPGLGSDQWTYGEYAQCPDAKPGMSTGPGVGLGGVWLRLEPMSSEPEESANISPAVRWGLGAVLFGLLAVSIGSAKGEWWTIVGAIACGAAACLFAARAILAARQSR